MQMRALQFSNIGEVNSSLQKSIDDYFLLELSLTEGDYMTCVTTIA